MTPFSSLCDDFDFLTCWEGASWPLGERGDQNSTEGHKILRSCFWRGEAPQIKWQACAAKKVLFGHPIALVRSLINYFRASRVLIDWNIVGHMSIWKFTSNRHVITLIKWRISLGWRHLNWKGFRRKPLNEDVKATCHIKAPSWGWTVSFKHPLCVCPQVPASCVVTWSSWCRSR